MSDLYEKAKPLAGKVMSFARDNLLVNMRFLDVALSALEPEAERESASFACNGAKIFYDPVFLLKKYKEEPAFALRMYLHILFHMIFYHSFQFDKLDGEIWSLSADIATEAAILELEIPGASLLRDEAAKRKLRVMREDIGVLTAERIYRYFKNFGISAGERGELLRLFFMDSHRLWKPAEEIIITKEQWKKLSERVRADLKSFSAKKSKSESMEQSLLEAVKDRYNYKELLQKFMVMNEDMQINDEEFVYIYYTYGLSRYGNMPLVELLEYRDNKKVREFVIAIDTSASCRGELVKSFLRRTYGMLCAKDSFFSKMNVHIIQCDHEVQKDTKITCRDELEYFLSAEKITGFGSTDFRPVFTYVDELLRKGEFENLKGLLYFTDGYGVYPKAMPPYDVMFVFPDNGDTGPEVPPWAVKVLLDDEGLD